MKHDLASTDWPLVFRDIDRDVGAWTPDSLRAAYIRHGCAVVRRAIDVGTIEKLRAVTADIFSHTSDVHVFEPQISEATQGRVSGFDLIAHPTLRRFLDLVFVSQHYRRDSATARRIKGRQGNADWQEPLELHVDSYFHEFWFTVNFWVPFDECGAEAPGIQLLPINYRETRRYSGFSRRPVFSDKPPANNGRYFPDEGLNIARVEEGFGAGCMFHPVMKPGDVVVASNWVVHGSYRTPGMAKGRTSMELRFKGACPDIAVNDRSDRHRLAAWYFASRVVNKVCRPGRTGLPFWAQRM